MIFWESDIWILSWELPEVINNSGPIKVLINAIELIDKNTTLNYKMNSFLINIRKTLIIHSIPTIVGICINHIKRIFPFDRAKLARQNFNQILDLEFDQKCGSDTSGIFRPDRSDVIGDNWIYGQKYQSCNPAELKKVINELGIEYDKFTFVDLGSGKGRAILVASSFPFKKIIGVEYSRHLDEIARINLSNYPDTEKLCKDINLICNDAVLFPIPGGPLVLYIYNSFGKQVMNKVYKNILDSYNQERRQIILIYFNTEFADVWRSSGFIKEKRISNKNAIYSLI